jgi:hypothetical protein
VALTTNALDAIKRGCKIMGISEHWHTPDEWETICNKLRERAIRIAGVSGMALGEVTAELLQAYIEGLAAG